MTNNIESLDVETTEDETEGVTEAHTPEGSADLTDPEEGVTSDDAPDVNTDSGNEDDEPDTFPRSVVEKLRKENAGYRDKAKKAETYARELFSARVAATGRLADPDDLSFDEALLDDHDALTAAVEELVARKPHLALRKPRGDVGAGATTNGSSVDLAGILRSRA